MQRGINSINSIQILLEPRIFVESGTQMIILAAPFSIGPTTKAHQFPE